MQSECIEVLFQTDHLRWHQLAALAPYSDGLVPIKKPVSE